MHDEGGIVAFADAHADPGRRRLRHRALGRYPEAHGPRGRLPWARPIPLPFLFIYGRRDATISVMGANIYPEDIEVLLYRDAELVPRLHSFLLGVVDDAGGMPRPAVALELTDLTGVDDAWREVYAQRLRDGLTRLNIDYRIVDRRVPGGHAAHRVDLCPGEGPFAADATRIKQRRVVRP